MHSADIHGGYPVVWSGVESKTTSMTTVSVELENTLRQLDAASASSLEQVVWDVLRLAKQRRGAGSLQNGTLGANGYPPGHFERLTGSWADVDMELPDDPPPDFSPAWS